LIRVVAYDIGLAAGPLHFVEGPEAFGVCFQMREHLDPGEAWVAVSSFFEAALQCGKQRFALVGGKGFVVHVWVPHGLQVFQVVQVFVSAAGFFVTLQIFQIDEAHFHPSSSSTTRAASHASKLTPEMVVTTTMHIGDAPIRKMLFSNCKNSLKSGGSTSSIVDPPQSFHVLQAFSGRTR